MQYVNFYKHKIMHIGKYSKKSYDICFVYKVNMKYANKLIVELILFRFRTVLCHLLLTARTAYNCE